MSEDAEFVATTLASLPAMTPTRLRALLRGRSPHDVVSALQCWKPMTRTIDRPLEALFASTSSRHDDRRLGSIWQESFDITASRLTDTIRRSVLLSEMNVTVLGESQYPHQLARDHEAPAVLFSLGDPSTLDQPRVGIVGTRHATAHGRSCARRFGEVLSAHGVGVVSGLARGIDVSAHRGSLENLRRGETTMEVTRGRPIGVVASGLDVVYPPEHHEIWKDVATLGLLVSESPPGTEPQAFRFPLRNRIIAALCDVLVVVESRTTGGSMITVRAALDRGVTVMAVPGSTSTRSAEGTNRLIRDGASIAVEPEDVLAVLGLETHRRSAQFDPRRRPASRDAEILELIGVEPMTLDNVVARSRLDLAEVALALGRLENQGWLMCTGGWFERI